MDNNIEISIVTPAYRCSECIQEFYDRLVITLTKITDYYQIIFVNDCSPANDWEIIKKITKLDKRVKGINLSRNFGQHYAITAGLNYAHGEWVVVMDCDLQDQPEEIEKLYLKAQEGYDIVVGKRKIRQDSFFNKMTSKLFYIAFNYLTQQTLDNEVANYGIYSKKVIANVNKLTEKDRSFGLLVSLVGFKRTKIDIIHSSRPAGDSSYNFKSRLSMAIDHILSHSTRPLILSIQSGVFISILSAGYAVWLIINYLISSDATSGWTSLMVLILFLSGLIISVIGVVGLYVGKIYDEVKQRPLYIIDEIIN